MHSHREVVLLDVGGVQDLVVHFLVEGGRQASQRVDVDVGLIIRAVDNGIQRIQLLKSRSNEEDNSKIGLECVAKLFTKPERLMLL